MQPGRHPVWMDFHIPDLNMSLLFVSSPHSVINKICVTANESVLFCDRVCVDKLPKIFGLTSVCADHSCRVKPVIHITRD